MDKQVTFLGSGEAGIFCQGLFNPNGSLEKRASAPAFADWETGDEIRKYLSTITASDKKKYCYVLVNALGAGEYFGSNINADHFPWNALCHEGDDYGYKTFLSAHAFQHHKNKDPTRAFGIPVLSVLNHTMKRVELIIRLDREKAKLEGADGIITRIDAGEFPDVSMGCFIAGTLITMADGTRKPIEQIQVGDEVITHRGRVRKVTELHRRKYSGSLYSVKAEAHPVVRSTRQHPWAFVNEDEVKFKDDHANLRWKEGVQLREERWIHAECLDDQPAYLLEPVFRHDDSVTPYVVQPTRAESRLLGYYLAEGHLIRDKKGELSGIELTTHMDDTVHSEIDDLCREFGTANAPVPFERVNSEVARGIWIFDRRLAEFCQRHAGQYSLEKRLSRDVLSWKPELQRELLGAYANGDGCGPEDGSLKLSTASSDLAHQWLVVLPRLGIIPSFSALEHKPGTGKATTDTTEYVVHIGKQWAQKLRDVTSKVQRVEIEKTKLSRKILDEKIVTPIREIDSIYVETDVFNFEVEDDNSYLVEGLAVHNCKVPYDVCSKCGNKSKTRDDYCVHMKPPEELRHVYGPNKILPDGSKIFVYNLHPRFFDISFVFIGADKTAKVMAKLASVGGMTCLGDVCAIPRPSAEIAEITGGDYVPEGLSKTAAAKRWFIIKPDGKMMEESELPSRPSNAQPTHGGPFTPWNRAAPHSHSEGGGHVLAESPDDAFRVLHELQRKQGKKLTKQASTPDVRTVHGIEIHVDRPKGFTKDLLDPTTGKMDRKVYKHDYGYVPGVIDNDGEDLDVFIGDHPSPHVFMAKKIFKETGKFDEHKVFLNFPHESAVKESFGHHIHPGCLGAVEKMTVAQFKSYLETHKTKTASAECACDCEDECSGDKLAEAFIKAAEDARLNADDGRYNCGAFMATRGKKRKLAEIIKEVPTGIFSMKRLPALESQEDDLSDEAMEEFASCPVPSSLGALGAMGIVMKPHEYGGMVLRRMGEDGLADLMGSHTLPHVHEFGDSDVDMGDGALDVLGTIFQVLGPYLKTLVQRRSGFSEPLSVRMSIRHVKIPLPTRQPIAHPLLGKISAAYNGYRRDLLTKLSQATEVVQSDPRLREMILGEGLVGMFSKQAHISQVVSIDSLSYMMGAHLHDRSLLSNTAVAVCDDGLLKQELLAQGY